jgi:outer membrane receptor protein involved in Fe transport
MGSVSLRADLGPARLAASLRHVGRFYLDNTQSQSLINPSYTVMDLSARIGLSALFRGSRGFGRTSLDLRVNNLFDARYTSFGYVDGGVALFIPAAGRNVYAGLTVGF